MLKIIIESDGLVILREILTCKRRSDVRLKSTNDVSPEQLLSNVTQAHNISSAIHIIHTNLHPFLILEMLALTSTTGKLGSATLKAILEHKLISPSNLVICTSSPLTSPKLNAYKAQGLQIRSFDFNSPDSAAFTGCTKLFLVSTPQIALDFNDAPLGEGREKHHFAAIDAARKAGVKHVVYTSLAFGSASEAGVMRAHSRTERYLRELEMEGVMDVTIIREGLYNSSWPLYLGYFDVGRDERDEIVVAGDGRVS